MNEHGPGWFGVFAAAVVGVGVGVLIGRGQRGAPSPLTPTAALRSRSQQELAAIAASLPAGTAGDAQLNAMGLSPGDVAQVQALRQLPPAPPQRGYTNDLLMTDTSVFGGAAHQMGNVTG